MQFWNLFDVVHLDEAVTVVERAEDGVARKWRSPDTRVRIVGAVLEPMLQNYIYRQACYTDEIN